MTEPGAIIDAAYDLYEAWIANEQDKFRGRFAKLSEALYEYDPERAMVVRARAVRRGHPEVEVIDG